ncbi:transglutaminase N-terminal domain-containing protein [Burkholderia ubonensis]|uniref:transglutaminase N-terminal domain-containing protein n=1 Tax=Burkholderia ubonensis TaxID=101571 RepID=UPI0009B38D51
MHIGIAHALRYTFDAPLQQALQRLRLRPLSNLGQTVGCDLRRNFVASQAVSLASI